MGLFFLFLHQIKTYLFIFTIELRMLNACTRPICMQCVCLFEIMQKSYKKRQRRKPREAHRLHHFFSLPVHDFKQTKQHE
jgi:hypothetical protein